MNNQQNQNNINTNNAYSNENNIQSMPTTVQPAVDNSLNSAVQQNNVQTDNFVNTNIPVQNVQPVVNTNTQNVQSNIPTSQQETQIQSQMQNIPTVEQSKEQFINNVQNVNQGHKEEKKETNPLILIGILFVVVLVAIYFLFPLLDKYI